MTQSKCDMNYTINIERFIAIFCVVLIHASFPGNIGIVVKAISRFAVPWFFMVSGYLLYDLNKEGLSKRIQKNVLKILRWGVFSLLLYMIWELVVKYPDINLIIETWKSWFSFKSIFMFLIFNLNPVGAQLWFLFALLYCHITLLLTYCCKSMGLLKIIYCSIILLLLNIILSNMLHDEMNYIVRNWLFTGIPCYYIGILMKRYNRQLFLIKRSKKAIGLGMVFLVTTVVENSLLGIKDMYVSSILLALLLLNYAVVNPNHGKNSWLVKNSNDICLNIYVNHIIVLQLINKIYVFCHWPLDTGIAAIMKPIIVESLAFIVAIICLKVSRKIKVSETGSKRFSF